MLARRAGSLQVAGDRRLAADLGPRRHILENRVVGEQFADAVRITCPERVAEFAGRRRYLARAAGYRAHAEVVRICLRRDAHRRGPLWAERAPVPVVDPPDDLAVLQIDDAYRADLRAEQFRGVGHEDDGACRVAEDPGRVGLRLGWPLGHVLLPHLLPQVGVGGERPAQGRVEIARLPRMESK
jgi:hypothetical protein